jgi:ABC-2 type transport system permease protein
MKFTIVTLKGEITVKQLKLAAGRSKEKRTERPDAVTPPFWVIVNKEIGDHVRSWRYAIMLGLIVLACLGSIITAITALRENAGSEDALTSFLFLRIFTASDGVLPSFMAFVGFLGPLMGIALGFDAVNSERNKGTLTRVIAQPIHRDDFINSKFVSALAVITIGLFALGFLVMGLSMLTIGYPPTPEEFWRVILFLLVSVVYVGFWLNLSILFSIRFKQAATSALSSISLWIFFTVFYNMIVNLINRATSLPETAEVSRIIAQQQWIQLLTRLSPTNLFNEATTTLLTPNIRALGPLTVEQLIGAIPNSPLPLGQSILLIWPHLTGILAATMICFGLSYLMFMRQEIRSRA